VFALPPGSLLLQSFSQLGDETYDPKSRMDLGISTASHCHRDDEVENCAVVLEIVSYKSLCQTQRSGLLYIRFRRRWFAGFPFISHARFDKARESS